MRANMETTIQVLALLVVGLVTGPMAAKEEPQAASLREQLEAQYTLARLGSDSGGLAVTEPGTVLTVKQAGLLGSSPGGMVFAAFYKDGVLHPPSQSAVSFGQGLAEGVVPGSAGDTRPLQVGEMVYVFRIGINVKRETITFDVIECDACNGVAQPSSYESQVVFQFAKAYLETANVSDIEDTIGQVLTIEDTDSTEAQPGQPEPQSEQPATSGEMLTNDDVIKMTSLKLGDSVIVAKIKSSACSFDTSVNALAQLKQGGVSDAVLQAMVEAGGQPIAPTGTDEVPGGAGAGPAQAWKSREEYDAFQAITKTPDANQQISAAQAFIQEYPASDFKDQAYQIEMADYKKLGKGPEGSEAPTPALPVPACADYESCFKGGLAALQASQWDSSASYFQAASSMNPSKPDPWAGLGQVYVAAGQYPDAGAAWDKALALGGTLNLSVWHYKAGRFERGTFYLGAKEASFVLPNHGRVFSAGLTELSSVKTHHPALMRNACLFGMKVGKRNYLFFFVPVGVECRAPERCSDPVGYGQEEAVANYVAQAVGKLASGRSAETH
jgi:tetratricopeptide (TPR) repeat protein